MSYAIAKAVRDELEKARNDAANALQRALKAFPCDTVTLSFGPHKVMIEGESFGIVAKLIDGSFPDYRATVAAYLGTELQTTIDPAGEPRIFAPALAAFTKAAGRLVVAMGDKAARLAIAGDDSWYGIMTLSTNPGGLPKGYGYRFNRETEARALEYLRGQRHRYDLPVIDGETLVIDAGRIIGLTCGERDHEADRWEERVNYETLTVDHVKIEGRGTYWKDGSYSIFFPRADRPVSDVAVEIDGEMLPLATHETKGDILLSADRVAALAGPVDPSTHVVIAPRPMAKAWWKKAAPALAPKPIGLTAGKAEMIAYATACQAAADMHNGRAFAAPVAVAEAPAAPIDETPAPVVLVDTVPIDPVAVEAPTPVAAVSTDSPEKPTDATDLSTEGVAALQSRVARLESIVDTLLVRPGVQAGDDRFADAGKPIPADPRARAVVTDRDSRAVEMVDHARAKRLRIVRRYLAMRRDRAALRALQVQHAIGQAQYDDVKARLATTEQALDDATARIEQGRSDARRYAGTEQALIDARARGDRMARVASRQRIGLARAAIDLRGARAETGAVRRQLAQALNPAPAVLPAPSGTMAVAFAAACR